ncbi:MAG: hypothetical protein ACOZAO_05975 [Patescibacteria group bacterium]
MQKFLVAIFLVNIAMITWAWDFLGLVATIVLSAGAYAVLKAKIGDKKDLPQKLSFGVVFVIAVFAVQSALQIPMLTVAAAFIEFLVFIMFIGDKN